MPKTTKQARVTRGAEIGAMRDRVEAMRSVGDRDKMPVSVRSIIARINRRLGPEGEVLKASRGARTEQDFGKYWVLNRSLNAVADKFVDLEELGRKLGVLHAWEKVTE